MLLRRGSWPGAVIVWFFFLWIGWAVCGDLWGVRCAVGVFGARTASVVGDFVWSDSVVGGGGVCFEKSGCNVGCGYSWWVI